MAQFSELVHTSRYWVIEVGPCSCRAAFVHLILEGVMQRNRPKLSPC